MPPKKPVSAYMNFANERHGAILERNPELPWADVAKQIGSEWVGLSDAEKEPFQVKAAEDKARYAREMAELGGNSGSSGELNATQVSTQSSSGQGSHCNLDSRNSEDVIAA